MYTEIYKTSLKETKDHNNGKTFYVAGTEKLNTVKITTFLKFAYRFNTITIKNSSCLFYRN